MSKCIYLTSKNETVSYLLPINNINWIKEWDSQNGKVTEVILKVNSA